MSDNEKHDSKKDKPGRQRRRHNSDLDEALEETFPASDPPAPTQPQRRED